MIEPQMSPDEPARIRALRSANKVETPLEERFERITRLAQRLLGTPVAAISLVDSDRQWFKSVQGADLAETPRSISFCGHVILQDDVMVVPDARQDKRFCDNPLVVDDPNVVFYAGCPVHAPDGQKIGTLCVIDLKPRELSQQDAQMLRDLAGITESELFATMQNAVQQNFLTELDEITRRSQIDSLMRIWNRESIFALLDREVARARRESLGNGVIMADIDHFKHINDVYGHPIGDEVLRQTAKRILSSIREVDALGRYGGEEFLIVLGPCDGLASTGMVAERIRRSIADFPFQTSAGPVAVTISLGAAYGDVRDGLTGDAIVHAADNALYRAKHGGRNRVESSIFKPATSAAA